MSDDWKPWPICPAEECGETEGVEILELIPGRTYSTVGSVCHHAAFLIRKPDTEMSDVDRQMWDEYFRPTDVPRETKES